LKGSSVDLHPEHKKKQPSGKKSKKKGKALLVGVGLDSTDGHTRLTRGPNFHLVGGSKETHEVMQETAIKVNEALKKRGRHLEEVTPREFTDILHNLK
jgi:hypothetical protein